LTIRRKERRRRKRKTIQQSIRMMIKMKRQAKVWKVTRDLVVQARRIQQKQPLQLSPTQNLHR
jgi:predicted nucleic acid-binding protein